MDKRWGEIQQQNKDEQIFRMNMLEQQNKREDSQRGSKLTYEQALIDYKKQAEMDLNKDRSGYDLAQIGRQESKEINVSNAKFTQALNKQAAKIMGDQTTDGLQLVDDAGTPYPRPLKKNELDLVYAMIAKKYPEDVMVAMSSMDEKFDGKTKMKTIIASYIFDPEIRAAVEKLLAGASPKEPPPQSVLDSINSGMGLEDDFSTYKRK